MYNNIEETIGQRIKAQRKRMGMTQEQLAEMLLLPKSTISAYENDKVDIKGSMLITLSDALQTDPNYLLGYRSKSQSIIEAFDKISDEKIKSVILAQIQAVAGMT